MKFSGTHRYEPLPHLQVQCYHGYQSMLFLWQHINLQYSVKFSHILQYNSKTIQSIFMNFSGKIDIVLSCTEKCIVTMDINQCNLYGNILTIHCQTFFDVLLSLKYLMNLVEILRRHQCSPLLHVHHHYEYQSL